MFLPACPRGQHGPVHSGNRTEDGVLVSYWGLALLLGFLFLYQGPDLLRPWSLLLGSWSLFLGSWSLFLGS